MGYNPDSVLFDAERRLQLLEMDEYDLEPDPASECDGPVQPSTGGHAAPRRHGPGDCRLCGAHALESGLCAVCELVVQVIPEEEL